MQFGKLSHSCVLTHSLSEAGEVSELTGLREATYAKPLILELGNLASREAEKVTGSQAAGW